ncbi:hypothetical protein [Gloeothece verrucosa]|uniref:Glycosyl transferase family 8 n=1 Tax=Gloeothece verrucosa (strain PCC 7822) TaxID=497965 RepID=E0UKW5_GLOV7|nr:hypothetical protein [Gloeothece verrucosa]ADN17595.1 conserved hypothetical protein [Gloeothece verrucosa PCC 7822]
MSAKLNIHSLLCHQHLEMGLLCLGSLLKFSSLPLQLIIHDDGSLTSEDIEKLKKGLKDVKIVLRAEADELTNQLLKRHPNCYKFRYENVLGLKLLDIPLFSQGDIAYCDSDVLFFRPFDGMFCWPNSETSALFMMDYQQAYSIRPWHLLGINNLRIPSKVNTGIMFIRNKAYDLDFIEWILGNDRLKQIFRKIPGWAEQTCWAALGFKVGCRLWHPQQIAMIHPGINLTDHLVAGHFISTYRFLLKNFSSNASIQANSNAVKVNTIQTEKCSILKLGLSQLNRKINR